MLDNVALVSLALLGTGALEARLGSRGLGCSTFTSYLLRLINSVLSVCLTSAAIIVVVDRRQVHCQVGGARTCSPCLARHTSKKGVFLLGFQQQKLIVYGLAFENRANAGFFVFEIVNFFFPALRAPVKCLYVW